MDIFDQSRYRLVIDIGAKSESIKDMMIHGMVIPVVDTTTEGPSKARCHDINTRFDEPPCQKQLLAPSVTSITISSPIILLI